MTIELDKLAQARLARQKNIAQWRANQINEHTLPSGLVVFMRDVDIIALAFDGKIPNTLLPLVDELQKDGEVKTEDLEKFGELLTLLCIECIVEPPFAMEADDTHVAVSELTGPDRLDVFAFANREVGNLKTFRTDENKPVDALQPGGDVPPVAVEADGAADAMGSLAA